MDMLQDEGAALIAEHLRPLLDRVDAERDCAVTAAQSSLHSLTSPILVSFIRVVVSADAN